MAYNPPPPGSTELGKPTPDGVKKQDVHITDLPPEVRKSFLMSMVFFPSMVGAVVCAVMFLGWVTIFKKKEPVQYALELKSPEMRRRHMAARELGERITPYSADGSEVDSVIYSSEVLTALLDILGNPDYDQEAFNWSPSASIKEEKEKGTIRWWAALMVGHFGGKLKKPEDKDRAYKALEQALEEKNLAIWAAQGLSTMREFRAVEALARHLESDPDNGMRWACAKALGSIGDYLRRQKETFEQAEKVHLILVNAYNVENGKANKDDDVLSNLAIALARMKDSTGLARLKILEADEDQVVREQARRALEMLK